MRMTRVQRGRSGDNPIGSNLLSGAERIREIGEILAAGFMRLRARKSSQLAAPVGDSFVDFSAAESGHAPDYGASR